MPRHFTHPAWKLGIVALVSLAFASCGTKATNPAAMEARELLDLLDGRSERLDLDKDDEQALRVRFHLVAIFPESQKAGFEAELPKYEKRIRDAAIALVGRTDHEQLAEPSLQYLKGEMVTTINRILQKRLVRDAAFSSFSFGYQWPREEDAPPRPKSSRHH